MYYIIIIIIKISLLRRGLFYTSTISRGRRILPLRRGWVGIEAGSGLVWLAAVSVLRRRCCWLVASLRLLRCRESIARPCRRIIKGGGGVGFATIHFRLQILFDTTGTSRY
jgi:hypothetical protein